MAYIIMKYIVMAYVSYGLNILVVYIVMALYLWPYIVMALYGDGPI